MADRFLAIADADKIHDYVFSPRELKMIRGGSAIQVELNYEDLPRLAKENGGEIIFRGGGTVLAEFPSDTHAERYCSGCEAEFAKRTRIATVSTAMTPHDEADFRGSLRSVRNALERNKQERRETAFNGGGSYWTNCHACGVYPAMEFSRSEPSALLCEACSLREQGSKRRKNYPEGIEPPADFDAIGAFAKPVNYVGLIYVDLDRLGRHLSDHAESSKKRYKEISSLIDESVRKAVQQTCQEMMIFDRDGRKQAGYEILLRGGDDAILLVPAQYSLRALQRFGELYRSFYESAATETPTPKFSTGLVIAHRNFPISDLLSIAEELLRSAKTLEEDSVDFAVVSSSMTDNPLEERRKARKADEMNRTMKPYRLADLMDRVERIRRLKAVAPASKVKALYRIAYEEVAQAELEYLDLLTRLDEESGATLRPLIGTRFWEPAASGRKGTHAGDIVELWDFCE